MTTVREIIKGAMRLINVIQIGEEPSADDMSVAIQAFDGMVDSWANDNLMIYTVDVQTFPTVVGKQTYTLGPGGDWDIPRPMEIKQAYSVWNSGTQEVELPITILNDAQYASIAVKHIPSSFPFGLYDNGNYPLREITLWPIPTTTSPVKLWLEEPLVTFATLDDPVSYPPGYVKAFRYNLAMELAPEFGKTIPDMVSAQGIKAKQELKNTNFIPQYRVSDGGLSNKRTNYNYITGGFVFR